MAYGQNAILIQNEINTLYMIKKELLFLRQLFLFIFRL